MRVPAGQAVKGILLARGFVPAVLVLGLVLRLAWALLVTPAQTDDFDWYLTRGADLAAGEGYCNNRGEVSAFWPIGYPALLAGLFALLGPDPLVAKLANIAFAVAGAWLALLVARRVFRSEVAGRVTLLLLAIYPNHVLYASLIASEHLFVFLLLSGTWLALRAERSIGLACAAGAVFGCATLVKPQVVVVPAVVVLLLGLASRRGWGSLLGRLACVHLVLLAVLVPWTVRNQRAFGGFVFVSTNGGFNLLAGNNPGAKGKSNWNDALTEQVSARAGPGADELGRDRAARQLALEYMRDNPREVLALLPRKLLLLYNDERDGALWNLRGLPADEREGRALLRGLLPWTTWSFRVLLALAAASLALLVYRGLGPGTSLVPALLPAAILAALSAICLVFFGSDRFHYPMVPLLAMYAGAGAALLLRQREAKG